ncbi:MAG: cryptochrome/photolyase family protein [Balneola sp.]|nr:MAG: cryptochrome/photolyase family protein [Balneola sp.]
MSNRAYLRCIDSNIQRPNLKEYSKAVFILHDQLNIDAWPEWVREEKPLLIFIESKAKGSSLPYHKKKLVYLLSSMRHFALEQCSEGYPVCYHSTPGHYDDGLRELLGGSMDLKISYMTPSEWETRQRIKSISEEFPERLTEVPNTFFLADADKYKEKIRPGSRMEYFYRDMRRQTGYLMNGEEPEGGSWNYDDQNREKLPKGISISERMTTKLDVITKEVIELVRHEFDNHFGEIESFGYAVTRLYALHRLNEFIEKCLDNFGPYEDAMSNGEPVIFHSHLSMYLNNGLLLPEEVCDAVIKAYKEGKARLNSAEGFIRQVIGWREFVRVYYEATMPEARDFNYFEFDEKLPELFWTADTKMNCMKECVSPVIEQGYSHHIPRLMVLSNFSKLTKTDPGDLNEWFWFAYVDAYEWVVLPNVLGMSTFADGGILASKPYVAGGNYINKMSDYCKNCAYKVKQKTGEEACPFNYLYWNFIDEQRETFVQNGRANFMVNLYEKKSEDEKKAIREDSEKFLSTLKRIS